MISRRDKLLIRPWQERRYDNHRRKVQSALPAIDTGPPASRQHVMLKLKKQQKENERCDQIEKDNYFLFRNMNYIMKTSRVDNCWTKPQPRFLNRVSLFETVPTQLVESCSSEIDSEAESYSMRKIKCFACNYEKTGRKQTPKETEKEQQANPSIIRKRSKSVPVRKVEILSATANKNKSRPESHIITTKPDGKSKAKFKRNHDNLLAQEAQSIVLNRGCLKLTVRFPCDTLIQLQERNVEKVLMGGVCNCRNAIENIS